MTPDLFFSILIPTKNRSHLVADAINSILNQNFESFEIIIIDNDDSNDTQNKISQITDHRIRYYRTGGLSMVENWEFGRNKTKGQFVTVLEDKQVYYPWALQWLYETITTHKIEVITWNWDMVKTERPPPPDENCNIISSNEILEQYTTAQHPWKKLPRLINSCVSQVIVQKICDKTPDNNFFTYFSPDLCAAFMQLATIDKLFTTNCRLGFINSSQSTACLVVKDKKQGVPYYSGKKEIDMQDAVDLVPIKNPFMPHNTIYNDYLHIRRVFPERLDHYKMTPVAYTKTCFRDLLFILDNKGEIKKALWQIISFMKNNLNLNDHIKIWYWFIMQWYKQKKLKN